MVKEIKITDFDYELPEHRIPLHPLEKRDECKLLLRSPKGEIYHRVFKELPDLLPVGSLLVCNDTKVINARMSFHKYSGANIELFLLEPLSPSDYSLNFQTRQDCKWKCLVGNSKKWKEGALVADIRCGEHDTVKMQAERVSIADDGSSVVHFFWNNPGYTFGSLLEVAGQIPIPPYLNRESEASDLEDYQTVYARVKGSVAAPTAGLHFTPDVFERIEVHNIKVGKVTLHVGAGTFQPVKSESIGNHPMHGEPFSVTRELLELLIEWKKTARPVIAVGTTSVRTLESLPYIGQALKAGNDKPWIVDQWTPYENYGENFDTIVALEEILKRLKEEETDNFHASTSIMIAPGFKWRITDGIITNFHQPKSTLLLLVSSFLGGDEWKKVYEEALAKDYRFLSYGDASLLL